MLKSQKLDHSSEAQSEMSALLLVFRPPCTLLFARGCGLETLAHDRNSCFTNGKKSSLNTDFFHTYTARKPQIELVWTLDSWFQKIKKWSDKTLKKVFARVFLCNSFAHLKIDCWQWSPSKQEQNDPKCMDGNVYYSVCIVLKLCLKDECCITLQ